MDKGSAVVIWGLKEYREEAYAQLGELEVYEKEDNKPAKGLNEKVITKLKNLKDKGVISDENRAYLKPEKEAKIGRFYLLPKIHKRLLKVPDRPMVFNSGTPTEKISEFFDFYLLEFKDKIYDQKLGTAIGTKFVPSFVNIFIFQVGTENVK